MQKRQLGFSPVDGSRIPRSYDWTAEGWRLSFPSDAWLFNPWTATMRNDADVKSDPQGLLIHDGESPIGAYTATELKADFAAGVARLVADTPAAARQALRDWAEQIDEAATQLSGYGGGPQPPPADHPLQAVFALAIEQATRGKGVIHGGEATPFLGQPWAHYGKMHGRGFLTGQAAKKLEEAASTRTGDAFITEALGALVYIGMAILKEQGRV